MAHEALAARTRAALAAWERRDARRCLALTDAVDEPVDEGDDDGFQLLVLRSCALSWLGRRGEALTLAERLLAAASPEQRPQA